MPIAFNLNFFRSELNLSQQTVADYLDIDRATYANWERGTTDIKAYYLPKLAKLFNVIISNFYKSKLENKTINEMKIEQHSIIISISDPKIALRLAKQLENIIENLKNTK